MMRYVLALDQGTTSSRAILFDREGMARASSQLEFPQIYPQPGWVEHDPLAIWETQRRVAREAIEQAGAAPGEIAALGITNQRETVVVWDRATGEPVYNAIVWQDRRTAAACDRLRAEGYEELIRSKTGLTIDAYFSGTKLAWILDNIPGARARAKAGGLAFGTIDSWLVWKLSGGRLHLTDPSNASRTMLFNIHTLEWDAELLEILNVPRAVLPEVRPSSAIYGETEPDIFSQPVAIGGIAGDQQAALFGQMCHEPGMMKITYGTGAFLLQNTGGRAIESRNGLITTVAWQIGGRVEYALEGSVFIAGAVVQWLRDGLGIIKESGEIGALAARVPDSGGVYFVPAFVGLGAPHWDAYARGTIVGLTRGTTAAHLARAAEEAIAYQAADVVRAMREDSRLEGGELRADGGAARDELLMQFQSDILQLPLLRPAVTEITAFGAAALAGLAAGFWRDRADLRANWQVERRFTPAMEEKKAAKMCAGWRKALERAKAWVEPE